MKTEALAPRQPRLAMPWALQAEEERLPSALAAPSLPEDAEEKL